MLLQRDDLVVSRLVEQVVLHRRNWKIRLRSQFQGICLGWRSTLLLRIWIMDCFKSRRQCRLDCQPVWDRGPVRVQDHGFLQQTEVTHPKEWTSGQALHLLLVTSSLRRVETERQQDEADQRQGQVVHKLTQQTHRDPKAVAEAEGEDETLEVAEGKELRAWCRLQCQL